MITICMNESRLPVQGVVARNGLLLWVLAVTLLLMSGRGWADEAPAPADLSLYVGSFTLPEGSPDMPAFRIRLEGGKLFARLDGPQGGSGPDSALVPLGNHRFKLDGMPDGYFVQFNVVDQKVTGLHLQQGTMLPPLDLKKEEK